MEWLPVFKTFVENDAIPDALRAAIPSFFVPFQKTTTPLGVSPIAVGATVAVNVTR